MEEDKEELAFKGVLEALGDYATLKHKIIQREIDLIKEKQRRLEHEIDLLQSKSRESQP